MPLNISIDEGPINFVWYLLDKLDAEVEPRTISFDRGQLIAAREKITSSDAQNAIITMAAKLLDLSISYISSDDISKYDFFNLTKMVITNTKEYDMDLNGLNDKQIQRLFFLIIESTKLEYTKTSVDSIFSGIQNECLGNAIASILFLLKRGIDPKIITDKKLLESIQSTLIPRNQTNMDRFADYVAMLSLIGDFGYKPVKKICVPNIMPIERVARGDRGAYFFRSCNNEFADIESIFSNMLDESTATDFILRYYKNNKESIFKLNKLGYNQFNMAFDNPYLMRIYLTLCPDEHCILALQRHDVDGLTPMHYIAQHHESLKVCCEILAESNMKLLMSIKDTSGLSACSRCKIDYRQYLEVSENYVSAKN